MKNKTVSNGREKTNEIDDVIIHRQSINKRNRNIEITVWVLLSLIIAWRPLVDIATLYNPPRETLARYFIESLVAVIVMFFPIIFRLVFNALPLESIRNRREEGQKLIFKPEFNPDDRRTENIDELLVKKTSTEEPLEFLADLALGSKQLARGIYSRAGVYLFIGVLIAFSGLAFFYLQTSSVSKIEDATTLLITLAPKFGILFFIEFIALFFLKQYRSAMDEFRYYESLQRSREETLAIVKLIKKTDSEIDIFEIIEKCGFRSTIDKLEEGQSTDLLEAKKLNKDETELFGKIIDIVGKR